MTQKYLKAKKATGVSKVAKAGAHPPLSDSLRVVRRGESIYSVDQEREMFFRAIKKVAPEVLSSLAKDVLSVYLKLYHPNEKRKQHYLMEWKYLDISQLDDKDKAGVLLALRRALYQWSGKYLLKNEWCLDAALQTLNRWACSGVAKDADLDWAYKLEGAKVMADEFPFVFEYSQWNFRADTWASYRAKALQAARTELMRYRKQMLERMSQAGQEALAEKRGSERSFRHFEFLVRYHIQKWKYSEIAAEYGYADEYSIAHIVPPLAARIGLELRKGQGRPAKG